MAGQTEDGEEDARVLELLRTPGLSIKYLDEETKERIRGFIRRNHVEKGRSLGDIAKLIGNKTSGYTSWLSRQLGVQPRAFEEARLKGIHEKVRKYERRPFDGTDEDRAYLLGLRHGDLSVSRPFGDAIRVSTSTTHPAMTVLFRDSFERYGHVYEIPRYKKDTNSYEWNLHAILDESFEFLMQGVSETKKWAVTSEAAFFAYLSGLLDADGSIVTTRDKYGNVYIFVDYFNSDRSILQWIGDELRQRGYSTSIRINKYEGTETKKYHIVHRSDYLQLSIYGLETIYDLLARLHPRHPEKIMRHSIATHTSKGQSYATVEQKINDLRVQIREERAAYVLKAKQEYGRIHTRKHE